MIKRWVKKGLRKTSSVVGCLLVSRPNNGKQLEVWGESKYTRRQESPKNRKDGGKKEERKKLGKRVLEEEERTMLGITYV